MNIRDIYREVFLLAEIEGLVEEGMTFEFAMQQHCENYDGRSEEELFKLFSENEYWHSLQLLNYSSPQLHCSYFVSSVNDGEEIQGFVNKIDSITQGDWVTSDASIVSSSGTWKLIISDNFSGTTVDLPEEGYSVGEEVISQILTYVNSLELGGVVVLRGADRTDAYYLPKTFVEHLRTRSLFDKQGNPASEFY